MPSLEGHFCLDAQREPDVTRLDTGVERLFGGAPAEWGQHEIADERGTARTELRIDRAKELTSTHRNERPFSMQRELGLD